MSQPGPSNGGGAGVKAEPAEEYEDMSDDNGDDFEDSANLDEVNQPSTAPFERGTSNDATLDQLIAENERLKEVFNNLNQRQTVLEEFIEVEQGDQFDTFLKNRERLVNVMGLGPNESSDKIDGRRTDNSKELAKLLKVVKSQAALNSQSEGQGANQPRRGGSRGMSHGGRPGYGRWKRKNKY